MPCARLALVAAALLTPMAASWAAASAPAAPPVGPAAIDSNEAENDEAPPTAPRDAVVIDDGLLAVSHEGRALALRLALDADEDYRSLAERLCGDPERSDALRAANGDAAPVAGAAITAPWELARAEWRYLALRALFPADGFSGDAWVHRPAEAALPGHAEGLWQAALWFTGDGANWPAIARFNGLEGPTLPRGRPLRIPAALLLPLFRPATTHPAGLRYDEDEHGPYAEYRLARGEALYSGVVLRFSDLTRPDDVSAAAELVRQRSAIGDVRRMPVGQLVRIPLELLSASYLPENHPRRVLARLHEAELAELAPRQQAIALEGVHLLLDPGHGGDDVGAQHGSVWESDYVYDVACRIKRLLQRETAAKAHLLTRDLETGEQVFDRRRLTRNKREVLATTPPLKIRRGRTGIAVNMRWYLANAMFRRLIDQDGAQPERVVFISLHADSLHRSLRGATIYVPGERFRRKPQGARGAAYQRYSEWREAPTVRVNRNERLRDEAVSRRLAEALLAGMREQGLAVIENRPVRDLVVRGRGRRRAWLPAVLGGTLAPAKVLLELVNLGNPQDAQLLADPLGRERLAAAVVAGLTRFYGGDQPRLAPAAPGAAR